MDRMRQDYNISFSLFSTYINLADPSFQSISVSTTHFTVLERPPSTNSFVLAKKFTTAKGHKSEDLCFLGPDICFYGLFLHGPRRRVSNLPRHQDVGITFQVTGI
jgi:hypothetical protein